APLAIGPDGDLLVASGPDRDGARDTFTVRSLDPHSGASRWETAPGNYPFELLIWPDGDVAVLCGPEEGEVLRLDGRDGQERARSAPYAAITQGVLGDDERLYLGCSPERIGHVCVLGRNGQET